jgi:hypothetical protein
MAYVVTSQGFQVSIAFGSFDEARAELRALRLEGFDGLAIASRRVDVVW